LAIGVDPSGNAWVTKDRGQIYRWNGDGWVYVGGCSRDIDVGADGSVWVIGCTPVSGGFAIYRWNGTGWVRQPGGAVRIAVDPSGNAWIINGAGHIYSS
jgi:hypothetical protein